MAYFHLLLANPPPSFTYAAIGSNPHAATVEELNDSWDQLMPVFVRERATRETVRCIHFDPAFERNLEFLKNYFKMKYPGLLYSPKNEDQPFYSWQSNTLNVYVITEVFNHEEDAWFLEQYGDHVLAVGGQLVVQDFSGNCMNKMRKEAYTNSSMPALFKKKILYDITYGDASCMTDMSKTRPIYDKSGNLVNFTLYTPHEMLDVVGISSELDALVKAYFIKEYKNVLNNHHVNYRRRRVGDPCLFKYAAYDDSSQPDVIMEYLQGELVRQFGVFKKLKVFGEDKEAEANHLMNYYKQYDVYDWYSKMNKLIT